jgi:AcrR family transcriptional regulator
MTGLAAVATKPPQDEDSSKRRQILDGARRIFMNLGYDAASMGEIARTAGVSKGTLYVYFTDKTALFEAIVEQIASVHGRVGQDLDTADHDVAGALTRFGMDYMDMLCRDDGGPAVRTIMAIAERMPEIGRRYYSSIIAGGINRLAQYLTAQTKAGYLDIADHELAAEQFLKCCQSTLFLPFVFQAAPSPSTERIAYVVGSAVRIFLAAYAAKKS